MLPIVMEYRLENTELSSIRHNAGKAAVAAA
jgi:hypothetical protein